MTSNTSAINIDRAAREELADFLDGHSQHPAVRTFLLPYGRTQLVTDIQAIQQKLIPALKVRSQDTTVAEQAVGSKKWELTDDTRIIAAALTAFRQKGQLVFDQAQRVKKQIAEEEMQSDIAKLSIFKPLNLPRSLAERTMSGDDSSGLPLTHLE